MTYDDLFEWIEGNYDLNEFHSAEQLINKVKTDWMVQGLEFPGGSAEDSITSSFEEYQQSLPYTNPEAYKMLESNMRKQQLVAEMLGNGEIARGYSQDMLESYENKKSEIMGIDFEGTVPEKPEPTKPQDFLQGGFGFVYGGAKSVIEKAKSQFGKWFRRGKTDRGY